MTITHICDRCGRPIGKGETRYVARIQVYAAPSSPEISAEDLMVDHTDEIGRLMDQCAAMSEDELMQDVYVELQYDLCRRCQRAYLANALKAI
jgi:hypothetical protein